MEAAADGPRTTVFLASLARCASIKPRCRRAAFHSLALDAPSTSGRTSPSLKVANHFLVVVPRFVVAAEKSLGVRLAGRGRGGKLLRREALWHGEGEAGGASAEFLLKRRSGGRYGKTESEFWGFRAGPPTLRRVVGFQDYRSQMELSLRTRA